MNQNFVNYMAQLQRGAPVMRDEYGNKMCSDPCNNCRTDENGNVTEDRCPNCGKRSKGEKVCMSCENDVEWQKHLDENGVDVTCQHCQKVFRAEHHGIKWDTVECAIADSRG